MDYLLHHLFLTSLKKNPKKECVSTQETSLTYEEMGRLSGALLKMLKLKNVKKGDRIAFVLDHSNEQAVAILGISATGAVFVPINNLLFPKQISYIINDSESRILITTKERYAAIKEELKNCPSLESVIFSEKLLADSDLLPRNSGVIEEDLAALLYTSGSTGQPKGVMISHKNLIAGCWIVSEYLNLNHDDRLLGVLPLSFDYGLNQLITMWGQGGSYRFFTFKYPNEIVEALARYKNTGLAGIPPVWALLSRSILSKTPLPHLRYVTNSGGALAIPVIKRLQQAIPNTKIFLMYGLTEAFRSTYLNPEELEKHPGSMGKAIPNTEIMVINKEGKLCSPGEEGILIHRGPTVSMGYWRKPEKTAYRFKQNPFNHTTHETVVYSGDIVKYDEEGYLYFVTRGDAMIKCSGHRISPAEIEEILYRSQMVKLGAAIGLPNSASGHAIKVFVIPDSDSPVDTKAFTMKLLDYYSTQAPSYMVPRYVEIVKELPHTASGKIDYPALKRKEL